MRLHVVASVDPSQTPHMCAKLLSCLTAALGAPIGGSQFGYDRG